jgi:mannose-6-phosphate isomerase-like protein (cupin superfamily)
LTAGGPVAALLEIVSPWPAKRILVGHSLASAPMQSWDVREIEAPAGTRLAAVLETVDGARAIIIRLAPGEELGDHQVRERTWLMVVEGTARIVAGDDVVEAGPGTLLTLEPGERHSVASVGGARIVMILSSWPAEGHYPVWPGDDLRNI